MSDFLLNRMGPIVTGTPTTMPSSPQQQQLSVPQTSFRTVLQQQLQSNGVDFSKHAVSRVIERNIDVSGSNLQRLREGLEIAQSKGLGDTLILIDQTAFIVNAQAGKVITTVSEQDLKGNVFTNIEGTVII